MKPKISRRPSPTFWRLGLCFGLLVGAFVFNTRRSLLVSFSLIETLVALSFVLQPSKLLARYKTFLFTSLGFVGWVVLSSVWSANSQALQISLVYLAAWILMAVLLENCTVNTVNIRRWLYSYSGFVAILAAYYLIHFALNPAERLQIGYILPNTSATLFFPAIYICLDKVMKDRKWRYPRLLALAALIVSLLALILTFSRGGLFSVLAGLIFYGWSSRQSNNKRQRRYVGVLAVAILMISIGWAIVSPQFTSRNLLRSSSQNLTDRHTYMTTAWNLFKAKPLIGQGIGSYAALGPIAQQGHVQSISINAHASLIQLIAELGVVGFMLMVTVGYMLLLTLWNTRHKPIAAIAGAGLIAMLLHFAIDIQLEYPVLILALAAQSALVMSLAYSSAGTVASSKPSSAA